MDKSALDEIKRKIRKLKKLEKKIRRIEGDGGLVWNDFFNSKYPLKILAAMDKETYKRVVEEYFFYVYYKFYSENRPGELYLHDPEVLSRLGLPPDADADMIKSKFRELAKIYHPDAGGRHEDFIRLMDEYKKLNR